MSEFLIFLRLNNIPLCVQTTFCLFSQVWCFHLLVIVNPAMIRSHNQDLYTLLWAWVYKYLFMSLLSNNLGHIPTCGIVVSYGNSIFNLRTCHIVFHSSWAILFSHQQCTGVQISLHSRQHFFPFLKKIYFIATILMGVKWYFTVVLICTSLMLVMWNIFSCAYWPFTHLLEMCLFRLQSILCSFHSIFSYPFSTYFLSIYYMPGIVLCTLGQQWPRQSQQTE